MSKDAHIKKTIEELNGSMEQLHRKLVDIRICIATLERMVGCEEKEQEQKQERPAPEQSETKTQKQKVEDESTASRKGPRNPSSRFKGVKKNKKPYKDGRARFEVTFYNKKKSQSEYLGSFDNEYLAAARYQERDGNKVEAQRLRKLADQDGDDQARPGDMAKQRRADRAEQEENNRDRPTDKKKKTVTIYVCNLCGLEYQKRGQCAGCGKNDMHETTE